MIKNGAGGAKTNENGLEYEKKTSLALMFENANINLNEITNCKGVYSVKKGNDLLGYYGAKKAFYRFVKSILKIEIHIETNVGKLEPDTFFYNVKQKMVYIIEMKTQSTHGSVDEKIQTGTYKRSYYSVLFFEEEINIDYIYILSDWFKGEKYRNVLLFLAQNGISYYFNKISLERLAIT